MAWEKHLPLWSSGGNCRIAKARFENEEESRGPVSVKLVTGSLSGAHWVLICCEPCARTAKMRAYKWSMETWTWRLGKCPAWRRRNSPMKPVWMPSCERHLPCSPLYSNKASVITSCELYQCLGLAPPGISLWSFRWLSLLFWAFRASIWSPQRCD